VLLSLEPAAGAIVGAVALSEGLTVRALVAIGLVILASIGATLSARRADPVMPTVP
jgi:inner membrane transporter RhtA